MDDSTPDNPYLQDELSIAPFSGRQQEFARLHQHLTDPARTQALLCLGRRRIGKTALMRQFDAVFDEGFIGVFIPLDEAALDSDADWLQMLVDASTNALDQRGFMLNRLTERTEEDADTRYWVAETRLPDIFATIRPHRRLVWMLDNADRLIDAIAAGHLPADSLLYLKDLLEKYAQLGMVLTLDTQYEGEIDRLSPLVNTASVFRLQNLTLEDTQQLIRQPVLGMYTVDDESTAAVFSATGGEPYLLQQFGFHIFHHWQTHPEPETITKDTIKALIPRVCTTSEDEFRQRWQTLSRDERLVLTAIGGLLYKNPLRKINTEAIQSWLVETDYPLDSTTINAAVRSLEYHEITTSRNHTIAINAGLIQKWLIENAQIEHVPTTASSRRQIMILAAVGIVVLILLVMLALSIPRGEPGTRDSQPVPTVTLVTDG